jgi:hypothetical protein
MGKLEPLGKVQGVSIFGLRLALAWVFPNAKRKPKRARQTSIDCIGKVGKGKISF